MLVLICTLIWGKWRRGKGRKTKGHISVPLPPTSSLLSGVVWWEGKEDTGIDAQRLLKSSFFLLQSICGARLLLRFW